MLFEFSQVLELKVQELSNEEIKEEILRENLFQHNKKSSTERSFRYMIKRADAIDDYLRKLALEESVHERKIINLYAIMKTDALFAAFMQEVIQTKLHANNYYLEPKDMNIFFATKAEQNEKVASWSETTIQKLKRIYRKILAESGFLPDTKSKELQRLLIDDKISSHIRAIGDSRYLHAMGMEE